MNAIHVRLFGKLGIFVDDEPECLLGAQPTTLDASFRSSSDVERLSLGGRKEQELLVYLLLYRDRQHRRETLANLLWEQSTTSQSLKYLRNTIWKVQASFSSDDVDSVVTVDGEWICLNSSANILLDIAQLEAAFVSVQGRAGHHLSDIQVAQLDEAIRVYRGDLLDGWYQDWCVFERERFRSMYLGVLDKLMAYCETQHLYERGIEYGTLILRPDRARERTHRRLMRLYYRAGDRTAALRQYDVCVAALREELDVAPGQQTQTLYGKICRDNAGYETPGEPADIEPLRPEDLLAQVESLQESLDTSQRQLQAIRRLVKQLLDDQPPMKPHKDAFTDAP